jgi:hypothetical protein
MNSFYANFNNVRIGASFMFNGSYYRKQSTRTAILVEIPHRVFYFKQTDIVTIYSHKDLIKGN